MDKPLTVAGLAELLEVSIDWVYTQVEAGLLPHRRLPGTGRDGRPSPRLIRFTREDVAEILADGFRPVAPKAPVIPIHGGPYPGPVAVLPPRPPDQRTRRYA